MGRALRARDVRDYLVSVTNPPYFCFPKVGISATVSKAFFKSIITEHTTLPCSKLFSHSSVSPVFSSSLEFFLLIHYHQAKCIIYCLTLNPAHGFILITNAAIQK